MLPSILASFENFLSSLCLHQTLTAAAKKIYYRSMGPQQDRSASKAYANGTAALPGRKENKIVRYKECQRNHAASIGGYAVDGCREFMASGAEGTATALLCAACGCHRSFHKREVEAECGRSSDTSGDHR